MSLSNGQDADENTFNDAFLSRSAPTTTTTAIVELNNAEPESLDPITNAQQLINEIADADGTDGVGDTDRKNYSNNFVIADGDSRKTALEKLSAAFEAAAGYFVASLNGIVGHVFVTSSGNGINVNPAGTDVELELDMFSRGMLENQTLADNTSTPTLVTANTTALNVGRKYEYAITRGAGNVRVGTLILINDGTNFDLVDAPQVDLGDVGVTFTTDIRTLVGEPCQALLFATTNTGTAAKLNIEFMNYPKPT